MPDAEISSYAYTVVNEFADIDAVRWDDYVMAHPDATFFHRAGWRCVIERSFGHRTHFLIAEKDGLIRGLLPLAHYKSRLFGNALISNGCCMGGGPIGEDDDTHRALDREAIALTRYLGAAFLEYRRPVRPHADWATRHDLYVTYEKRIEADEELNLKQIPRKQRAVIRKSLTAGLSAEIEHNIDRFYPLYAETVHRLGTPVFGKSYFQNLLLEFGNDCDILTVTHNGKAVSSVLSFYFRDRVMPYYAGAGSAARDLGANDFMYWSLMRTAVARGYTVFDFGRSKVDSGPSAFKKNWGFEPVPVTHEYYLTEGETIPEINPRNPKYRLFIALWKKLPRNLANLIGPIIVRGIG